MNKKVLLLHYCKFGRTEKVEDRFTEMGCAIHSSVLQSRVKHCCNTAAHEKDYLNMFLEAHVSFLVCPLISVK